MHAQHHVFVLSFHREPLDMDRVHEAMTILSGTKNYASFTSQKALTMHPWVNTTKTIQVSVAPGEGYMYQHVYAGKDHFRFWDFEFHGTSFLYKQVFKNVKSELKILL